MTAIKLAIAALALTGASPAASPGDRGLLLTWRESEGRVSLSLVTSGMKALTLRYELSVTGLSRSRSSGRVTVRPGEAATVATVQIHPAQGWHAVLDVTGDQTYRIEARR